MKMITCPVCHGMKTDNCQTCLGVGAVTVAKGDVFFEKVDIEKVNFLKDLCHNLTERILRGALCPEDAIIELAQYDNRHDELNTLLKLCASRFQADAANPGQYYTALTSIVRGRQKRVG